jgi:hypothetical protein
MLILDQWPISSPDTLILCHGNPIASDCGYQYMAPIAIVYLYNERTRCTTYLHFIELPHFDMFQAHL